MDMRMQDKEVFPLYIDRFPIQLLSFLRFARIQDVAQLASSTFEQDVIVTQMNEYEVLQLVMGDMRERLQEYLDNQVCPRSRYAVCYEWWEACAVGEGDMRERLQEYQ